jgi:hypothetical protein
MISHFIDFFVAFFTHPSLKKIFGAILALVGLAILGNMGNANDPNIAVLYACIGILIGGIGCIIIYYDIANDKSGASADRLNILTKAYEQNEQEKQQADSKMTQDNMKKSN